MIDVSTYENVIIRYNLVFLWINILYSVFQCHDIGQNQTKHVKPLFYGITIDVIKTVRQLVDWHHNILFA